MTTRPRTSLLLAVVSVPLALVAGLLPGTGLAHGSTATPGAASVPSMFGQATASRPATGRSNLAPPLFTRVSGTSEKVAGRPPVAGANRLVGLRTTLLPARATGQRLPLDLFPGTSYTARVTQVAHARSYTAWTGPIDAPLGSFTLVRVGSVYRGEVSSPQGNFAIASAADGGLWVTRVAAYRGGSADDVITPRAGARWLRRARLAGRTAARAHQKSRIDVMIGFTDRALHKAGGKAQIKADAALVVSDTNKALSNSHIRVRVRLKGVVHTRDKETTKVFTDVRRLYRPHDRHLDGLLKQRRRHHADLVHLLTGGSRLKLCGAGYEPIRRRFARPALGVSVSFVSCLPYLVATHELGHNMGADHIKYPGVSHDSKLPFAHGHYNVKQRYLTVMGYYDPCTDKQIYDCQRIPYYSSPKHHYLGSSLGNKRQHNSKAIRLIAPLVATYAHR